MDILKGIILVMLVCAILAMLSFYCDMVLAFNLKKEDLAILNKLQQEIFKIFSKKWGMGKRWN